MRKLFSFVLLAVLTTLSVVGISVNASKELKQIDSYYYNQLLTENSKRIYQALDDIRVEDKFKTGTYTLDLVSGGYLENRAYDSTLMNDFAMARDSFRFDHPELFYVDFDKISIRQTQNATNYRINLGVGRSTDYFSDGFNTVNVNEAIDKTNSKVDEIINKTKEITKKKDILSVVYKEVIKSATYKLEENATLDNKYHVRSSYGTLVRGEALCEGFAKTTKVILDKLGFNNVLVQGSYLYEDRTELHMWNYVQMEDNRWYLLDTTMDNGLDDNGGSTEYFLKSNKDKVSTEYVADGVVSASSGSTMFELNYPCLSIVPYSDKINPFTVTIEGDKQYVSYNNMGLAKAMEQGKYIVYTFDSTLKGDWYYVSHSFAFTAMGQGNTDFKLSDIDEPTRFDMTLLGDFEYVYAVTDIKPKHTFEDVLSGKIKNPNEAYKYNGNIEGLSDFSNLVGNKPVAKASPYPTNKTPNGVSLEEEKEYTVSVTYSEDLTKIYSDKPVTVKGEYIDGEVEVRNVKFDETKSNVVTFTFTTKKTFYRSLTYLFTLENVLGKSSRQAPREVGFVVVHNVEFACPKVEGAINTVYTNKPALVTDGDMSAEGWTDKDGKPLASDLPFKLALIASKPTASESTDMENKITNTGEEVLKSSTYKLNLQLCSQQVAFLKGNKLKVLMPFPEGYGPEDKGVVFKAYHFKDDGTPELIESVVTEHGIIMYVDAFSPFAIVAAKGENTSKNVMVQVNGNASVDHEYIALDNGSKEVTITLGNGYAIDYVSLNGKVLEVNNNKVTVKYEDLKDFGNVLEVNTLVKSILDKEQADGFVTVGKEEQTNPDSGETKPEENSSSNNTMIIIISVIGVVLVIALAFTGLIMFKKSRK